MNTAVQLTYTDNLLYFPGAVPQEPERRSTSLYKSNGIPKATAADPIRDPADIKAMQQYYLSRGQIRNYTIFTMGIMFGIRGSDLCEMKIHHILTADGHFKSHCDMVEKKTRKFNNPVITPALQRILTDYMETLGDYSMDDYLFRSRQRDSDGNYAGLKPKQLHNIIKAAAKACNVPGHISPHSMRKTFAYQLLKQNPDNDEVKFALQKMLNHDSFQTTLTYCGLAQDAIDKYRAGLEEVLI